MVPDCCVEGEDSPARLRFGVEAGTVGTEERIEKAEERIEKEEEG